MPWVLWWIFAVALLGRIAWSAGYPRHAAALAGVLCALPVTFYLYNLSEHGALFAGLLWATFPVLFIYQGLGLKLPAILGELSAIPYIGYAFGWFPESSAQIAADILGLAMVISLGGRPIVGIVGRFWTGYLARYGNADRLFGASRDAEGR